MTISAGWYADETMPGFDRYWDGTWWTAQTRESAKHSEGLLQPPSKPNVIAPEPSSTKPLVLLTINREDLIQTLGEMMDRDNTAPIVLQIYDMTDETLKLVNQILDLHLANAGRGAIRPKIQLLVAGQKEQFGPELNELALAMEEDFNLLVKEMGGSLLLPVSLDEAWENYVAPIKRIMGQIEQDMTTGLRKVAEIEEQYLFV